MEEIPMSYNAEEDAEHSLEALKTMLDSVHPEVRVVIINSSIAVITDHIKTDLEREWQENSDKMAQLNNINDGQRTEFYARIYHEEEDIYFSFTSYRNNNFNVDGFFVTYNELLENFIRQTGAKRNNVLDGKDTDNFDLDLAKLIEFYRNNKIGIIEDQIRREVEESAREIFGEHYQPMPNTNKPKPRP